MHRNFDCAAAGADVGPIDMFPQQRIGGVEPATLDGAAHRDIGLERIGLRDGNIRWPGVGVRPSRLLLSKARAGAASAKGKAANAKAAALQHCSNKMGSVRSKDSPHFLQ